MLDGTLADFSNEYIKSMIQEGTLSVSEWNLLRKRTEDRKPNAFSNLYDLSYTDFSKLNLSSFNFDRCDLSFSNFSGSNLSSCSFKQSRLSVSLFEDTDLSKTTWSFTNALKTVFDHCNLKGARIDHVSFYQALFCGSDFSSARLYDSDFSRCMIDTCTVDANTVLTLSTFLGSTITKTDLSNADLYDIYFDLERVCRGLSRKQFKSLQKALRTGVFSKQLMGDAKRTAFALLGSISEGDTPENNHICFVVDDMLTEFKKDHRKGLYYIFRNRGINKYAQPSGYYWRDL